jgi:hypothetical protein
MAEGYYNLEEVMGKLGKTEEQIKELVKEGRLREFRDGSGVLFKVGEVDAFTSEVSGLDISSSDSEVELMLDETGLEDGSKVSDEGGGFGLTSPGNIASADTSIGTTGINVLGETDDGYKLTEDTKAETQFEDSEPSEELGSLDGDSSLESVGSGSGLLDLSLQADDTSLGAVLDDILPSAGEGGAGGLEAPDGGMAEEADKIFEQAQPDAIAPVVAETQAMPRTIEPRYVEIGPDAVSNACGIALFVPLIAVIYAAIVVIAGMGGVEPGILRAVAKPWLGELALIWHISIGLMVLILCIVGIAALMGGGKGKGKMA